MPKNTLVLLVASLILPLSAAPLLARQDTPTRVAVTVALVDDMPYGNAASAIVRRAEGSFTDASRHDVIVLRSNGLNARKLSSAIMDLLAIRRQQGDTASVSRVVRVHPRGNSQQGRTRRVLPWAQRVIDDLREAEPRLIDGLGEVRAVDIWLPPQRGNRSAPAGGRVQ